MENRSIEKSVPEWSWTNIIFFTVTTVIGVFGTPVYLARFGFHWVDWALFTFYVFATGMGITVGYHRLFAHRTFKVHPVVKFLLLFFGAAAFEQTAFLWASQHRDHHLYVDTDRDPYSIKKGFFYAHIGWLMFWRHPEHFENAKDLKQDRMVMNQHKYYLLWCIGSGILVPLLIGAAIGHFWGALVLTVCLRITFVYHSTFFINSVCHMFGKSTYDIHSTAKDHWFVALLTFGEGYHNFHHRFPSDYRNAVRWYQWDPSKWAIFLMSRIGLASDLRRVSDFRILGAKLAGERQLLQEQFSQNLSDSRILQFQKEIETRYVALKHRLVLWEQAAQHYHELAAEHVSARSAKLYQAACGKLAEAKKRFEETLAHWESLRAGQLNDAF